MASSALQKLLRKSPPTTRIITCFHTSQAPPLNSSRLQPLPLLRYPFFQPIHPSPETEEHLGSSCSSSTVIFPSFPFGFSLNPISSNGSRLPEDSDGGDGDGDDDAGTLWADSVKKKRKRKMNKHKYKKLRKRMRRQS